ncbi:MAG: hypothetical protein Q7J25_12310 [Vicinamibacterales bacterium]|nr:hypothetical protein [Vicinamibacterales bacterium]
MKTIRRLRREITYYTGLIGRSTSRDRIREAHQALAQRERELAVAVKARKAISRRTDD